MATRQDQFAEGIATRVISRTERGIERRAGQFPLMAAFWLAVVLVGSNAVIQGMLAAIHETDGGLRDAFAEGLVGAQRWRELMKWNRITIALAQCAKLPDLRILNLNGRHSCNVPLWIEPLPVQTSSPVETDKNGTGAVPHKTTPVRVGRAQVADRACACQRPPVGERGAAGRAHRALPQDAHHRPILRLPGRGVSCAALWTCKASLTPR